MLPTPPWGHALAGNRRCARRPLGAGCGADKGGIIDRIEQLSLTIYASRRRVSVHQLRAQAFQCLQPNFRVVVLAALVVAPPTMSGRPSVARLHADFSGYTIERCPNRGRRQGAGT